MIYTTYVRDFEKKNPLPPAGGLKMAILGFLGVNFYAFLRSQKCARYFCLRPDWVTWYVIKCYGSWQIQWYIHYIYVMSLYWVTAACIGHGAFQPLQILGISGVQPDLWQPCVGGRGCLLQSDASASAVYRWPPSASFLSLLVLTHSFFLWGRVRAHCLRKVLDGATLWCRRGGSTVITAAIVRDTHRSVI